MNNHLPLADREHPVPLSSRPDAVQLRERLITHRLVSDQLSVELGHANRILNFISGCHHITIHQGDGYYQVNADGRVAYSMDLRTALSELAP